MSHPANAYVGLPFRRDGRSRAGLDCKGLVQLVLDDHLPGVALPLPADVAHPEAVLQAVLAAGAWRRVETPQAFDVVVMFTPVKTAGRFVPVPKHLGIMVSRTDILHIDEGQRAQCLPVNAPSMRLRREGFYRHISQVGD